MNWSGRLLQSPFARAVMAIGSATATAQLIAAASSPILARLFSPSTYGVFFVVSAVGAALSAGLALRLELAIPLPKADQPARNLVTLGMLSVLATSLILLSLTAFCGPLIDLLGPDISGPSVFLVVPLAGSAAILSVFNAMAIRERRFTAIAQRQLVVAVITVLLQIGIGLWLSNAVVLAGAVVLSQSVAAFTLYRGSPIMRNIRPGPRRALMQTLRRYRRFPLVLTPAAWLNSFGANLPVILVGVLYTGHAAGLFGLTTRVLSLPVALIGTAIGQVFVSELAARRRDGSHDELALFSKTSKLLLLIGGVVAIAAFVFSPWIFPVVFGADWRLSGELGRPFAVVLCAQLVASPMSMTLVVYEKLGLQISWDAARLSVTVLAMIASSTRGLSLTAATWVFAITTALSYAVNWWMCWRVVRSASLNLS